jgi:hypothetical protein
VDAESFLIRHEVANEQRPAAIGMEQKRAELVAEPERPIGRLTERLDIEVATRQQTASSNRGIDWNVAPPSSVVSSGLLDEMTRCRFPASCRLSHARFTNL